MSENAVEIWQYVILAGGKIVGNIVKYIINFGLISKKWYVKEKKR